MLLAKLIFEQIQLHIKYFRPLLIDDKHCAPGDRYLFISSRGQGCKSKESTDAALNHHLVLDEQRQKGKGV